MALVLKAMVNTYYYLNEEVSDPRTRNFFMMDNPFPTAALLGLYLMFVLKWGPKFMENRKPFNLDKLIQLYNLTQVILCSVIVYASINLCYGRDYSWFCQPIDFSPTPIATKITHRFYLYFVIKVLDLLDTVFFVLRKKQNQVSFLHVYHHTGMVMLSWSAVKFLPGGHGVFMGAINSFVHIVMYSYYFITSYSPKYKQNLWWKKHITQLQMIQFFMIFLHFAVLLMQPNCDYPKFTAGVLIPQNLFMFMLFGDFYLNAYRKKKSQKPASIENDKNNSVQNTGQTRTQR